jgi:hypothetical protein
MLNYGFFHDFKGSDTLLFDGGSDDLGKLVELLKKISNGEMSGEISLERLTGFCGAKGLHVNIAVVSQATSEAVVSEADQRTVIKWMLSRDGAAEAAQHVSNVAADVEPSHTYLEEGGNLQIIAAKEEYGPAFFSTEGC